MSDAKVKAVLFDLGETLLTFGKVDAVGLFRQGGQRAYDFLREMNQPVGRVGCFLRKHLMMIRLYHIWSTIAGRDFDSSELLRKQTQKKGVKLSAEQWKEFAWCWYAPLSKFGKAEEGVKETLGKLKAAGLKLGILSNTFINAASLERHLEQFGLLDFFDIKLYSYQFNYRKPDRRIFIDAASKINIAPENTLFVGDRLDTDVAGSMRANMLSVLKKAYTNRNKKVPGNVIKIEKLAELPGVVEKINNGCKV
ncbi:MAG: HAD family hydrolase [Anaerohalosphaeraceae bacterium]|nr:HAD family hydrolase [Anaerohalosphaeraceae bacterium]